MVAKDELRQTQQPALRSPELIPGDCRGFHGSHEPQLAGDI